ncbi:hypothetical protein QUF90_03575 [Desulfococcaceae bacterium HSG9]|nr:hypothetical protein [Desulfococcaceae bacterium HSG9]
MDISYNDIFDNAGDDSAKKPKACAQGTETLTDDPLFADADDYHLADDSPCIDVGDPELEDEDGSRSDMGAYGGPWRGEYSSCDMPPCEVKDDDDDSDDDNDSDDNDSDDNDSDDNDSDGDDADYTPLPIEPDPSPVPVPVYRFFSKAFNAHHFCGEFEKNHILATYPEEIWKPWLFRFIGMRKKVPRRFTVFTVNC